MGRIFIFGSPKIYSLIWLRIDINNFILQFMAITTLFDYFFDIDSPTQPIFYNHVYLEYKMRLFNLVLPKDRF